MYSVEDYKKFILESLIRKGIISVKHGAMWYNLCDTLKAITDSKEEYRTLRDDIYYFRKDTKKSENAPYEILQMKGTNGTFFGVDGDEHSVTLSDKMKEFSNNANENLDDEQVLYSIHNHVDCTCFQSYGDISVLAHYGGKYNITSGKDGIMIIKTIDRSKFGIAGDLDYIGFRYDIVEGQIDNDFQREYSAKIQKIEDECLKYDFNTQDEYDEYMDKVDVLYQEYIGKHIGSCSEMLNDGLKDNGVEVYYIPNHYK